MTARQSLRHARRTQPGRRFFQRNMNCSSIQQEKKKRAYVDIIDSLYDILQYCEMQKECYEEGSSYSKEKEKEFKERQSKAFWKIKKATDIGAFVVSQEAEEILSKLGDGIYISNLHYLNWSDIQKGKLTGMTRYACFWVENGQVVAPIADLRFDESLYNILGDNLESITNFSEIIPNVGSYGVRSLGGKEIPGLIVKDFEFTL